MATEKQIAANRQNAKNSTGPRTEYGKSPLHDETPSATGLWRRPLSAFSKTPPPIKALQRAIYADYHPRSTFELQLVARLVSLLWRLRRAVAIESGLLNIQAEFLQKRRHPKAPALKGTGCLLYRYSLSLSRQLKSNTDQQRAVPK